MLVYDVNQYGHGNVKDNHFYKDLLSSVGIPSRAVAIKPLISSVEFAVSSGEDFYFDVANPALGDIVVGNQTSRTLLHGNLLLSCYCSAFTAAGAVVETMIATGPNSALTHFQFAVFEPTAVDSTRDLDNWFPMYGVAFNYFRMRITGGNLTFTMEALFQGIQITY